MPGEELHLKHDTLKIFFLNQKYILLEEPACFDDKKT